MDVDVDADADVEVDVDADFSFWLLDFELIKSLSELWLPLYVLSPFGISNKLLLHEDTPNVPFCTFGFVIFGSDICLRFLTSVS